MVLGGVWDAGGTAAVVFWATDGVCFAIEWKPAEAADWASAEAADWATAEDADWAAAEAADWAPAEAADWAPAEAAVDSGVVGALPGLAILDPVATMEAG